ncbi:sensor histidine kinase [Kribbella sp. CA-293567]|uniref:sensor histidine kinase n=1 Tax=Kribbella sp. CA-293567 TaxID=3002436 RepID=UPI0022DD552F|nr:sensor histidine kinase [Kribbella sp. CA-293567]WBQ05829.1 sensor histidine kinase [Kribbella sp. CA-293567]
MSRSSDVLLAVIGLAITQVQLCKHPGGWPDGSLIVQLLLAVAPALIAVRRVDPVLASVGLVIGTFFSMVLGQVDFVLLAGSLLALWSLADRCRITTAVLVGLVVTGVPMVGRFSWGGFEAALLPSIYREGARDPFRTFAFSEITAAGYNQMLAARWPWWLSIALFAACLLGVLYRVLRRRAVVERTLRERLDDLRGFVLTVVVLDVVLAMTATSLILWDLGRDLGRGYWWSAPDWMPYAIAFSALTLVLRRRWPVGPVVVLAIGALLTYWQTWESWTVLGALAVALYSLAANWRPRHSLPIATAVLVGLPALAALVRYPQLVLVFPELRRYLQWDGFTGRERNFVYEGMVDQQWPALLSLALALPVLGGVLIRLYRRNRATAAREAELEQLTQEQDAAQVVLTERSHIARDLHDVVAHAVNLMVIQAETGPDLLQRGDREVLAGFQRIGDTGRRALGELDRLLSALRDADGVPDPQLAPQPGLAEIRQLVRDVSHERLTVSLQLDGDPSVPPTGHQLTAYRLVQEALTNVARHAEATRAGVVVQVSSEGIGVTVTDDGIGFDLAAARKGGRHGLAGMRERVRIHDGRLEIRSAPGSGTVIEAWLPVATPGKKVPEASNAAVAGGAGMRDAATSVDGGAAGVGADGAGGAA